MRMASDGKSAVEALLRCGQGSVAELFVAQMQDYLGLGGESRINVPGVGSGNWRFQPAAGHLLQALGHGGHAVEEEGQAAAEGKQGKNIHKLKQKNNFGRNAKNFRKICVLVIPPIPCACPPHI